MRARRWIEEPSKGMDNVDEVNKTNKDIQGALSMKITVSWNKNETICFIWYISTGILVRGKE